MRLTFVWTCPTLLRVQTEKQAEKNEDWIVGFIRFDNPNPPVFIQLEKTNVQLDMPNLIQIAFEMQLHSSDIDESSCRWMKLRED